MWFLVDSPTEVRRAVAYLLNNARRHAPAHVTFAPGWIDPLSSAQWFNGWRSPPALYARPEPERLVIEATTWLLSTGWRLRGLLAPDEVPGDPAGGSPPFT